MFIKRFYYLCKNLIQIIMFKSVKNYFKNRRERKIRERLVLKIAHDENHLEKHYNFILTGRFE
jgi:hypothetical protein